MKPARSEPPIADEAAALEQLEHAEAAVQAAPTPRVLTRALVMLDRLFRAREIEEAAGDLGTLIDKYHAAAREHGALTDEDIEAEIRAARAYPLHGPV
jgi:hypothetical protein